MHPGSLDSLLRALVVTGFIHTTRSCRWVHLESLCSLARDLRVVGFMLGHLVHLFARWGSRSISSVIGFTSVSTGSLDSSGVSSLADALWVVGFIQL